MLDPAVLPAQFPAPDGMSETGLRTLLHEVAGAGDVLGGEVTAFEAPADEVQLARRTELAAGVVRGLLG